MQKTLAYNLNLRIMLELMIFKKIYWHLKELMIQILFKK